MDSLAPTARLSGGVIGRVRNTPWPASERVNHIINGNRVAVVGVESHYPDRGGWGGLGARSRFRGSMWDKDAQVVTVFRDAGEGDLKFPFCEEMINPFEASWRIHELLTPLRERIR